MSNSDFKLSGDFRFDSYNIKSMDEFSLYFVVQFKELSKDEHLFMRSKISDHLGLKTYSVPEPWGDNPARYEVLRFETYPKDFERCKTMIKLLQESEIEMTANGYRYPPDADHPLMITVNESEELHARLESFNGLKGFIEKIFAEAQQKSPSVGQGIARKNTPA